MKTVQSWQTFTVKIVTSFIVAIVSTYTVSCLKRHTTYGSGEMEKWPVAKTTEDFLEKCEVHKEEKLKMFCEDHSQLCCLTCVLLNHRQCSKVTLISHTNLTTTDFQQLSTKIDTILDQLMKLQRNWESNMKSVQVSYEEQLQELRNVRQKINEALDDLEKTTMKEMDEVKASLNASLKNNINDSSRLHSQLKCLSGAILEVGDKNKELAFIACQKSQDMIKQADTYLQNKSVQTEVYLTFISTDIKGYLSSLTGLGYTVHNKALTVTGKIPVSDTSALIITGICGLSNGQILVADLGNCRVKSLVQKYTVVNHCDLSDQPWDVSLISPSEVAVTLGSKGIQFVSVVNGQLVKGRALQLAHACNGIAHYQGHLYVTSGTALYQYTLSGTQVNKLYEDTPGSRTVWKCALSPSGEKIFVTNADHHSLLTLARDGTVVATFTDPELKNPWNVHVTAAGQVLVCGCESHTIIQVDSEGRRKIATLATQKDGVKSPLSVFYCGNTGAVIVGQNVGGNILVFEVKSS